MSAPTAPASALASPLAQLIPRYLAAAAAEGYAASTLDSRRRHLAHFTTWCDARGLVSADQLTPAILERYRLALFHQRQPDGSPEGRPLTWATQAAKLTAVRMLLAWAARAKWITVNPAADLALPRLPKRLPRAVLSVSEAERVLAQPDVTTALGLRDRAILEVLYSTGLRRHELIGLDGTDVNVERGLVFVREGKGKKDRLVPIGDRAIAWTIRYLDQVRPRLVRDSTCEPACTALFLTRQGTRLKPQRLTGRLHRYLVASGVAKPGSCHVWRHTAATLMHEGGADIRDLQELLGHAQLSTTELYTHVSIARLQAVHARTHPAHHIPVPHVHARAGAASSLAAGAAEEEAALTAEHQESACSVHSVHRGEGDS